MKLGYPADGIVVITFDFLKKSIKVNTEKL